MTRKKALERRETKIGNTEVTPQAIFSHCEILPKEKWTKGT
jgi:hypothetical protein